ncbi:N-acetylmuramoyl-L-alanine amidase [Burkholderia oklahomensis]|uniref:N-acetylmuramoyl-L-alanine amidase n=1 Tax=Burkholderia oklahomensis TaxID=342113 RepID=A0AAI8FQX9_9BURK|nr:N-acetylmuramoyl-L-alanine amidase [Burkholderia oklahomensis]AIO69440.1 N-acetylmuramoyl-L-alanine amidase family protein [Burkholderia oklahomensis]AOI40533.1 N-acetylmuramoyl-L-alanine amidase [Burkholderia oklahomensis EO147]KUY65700.1 N-acetylmuramoyl-L-alanine amidase [Burkholderia oklahomensis EO147]QPS40792.1 N-acetylmuramoyl-L-alanine amidase [Burkholderia oklahomensis]
MNDSALCRVNNNRYRSVRSYNSRVRFLILHYTALDFSESIRALTGTGVSAHYLVPDPTDKTYRDAGFKDLQIFNLVDEKDRAWHAGVSAWEDRTNLNDCAIGIETVNLAVDNQGQFYFPPYEERQQVAIAQLAANIVARYPDITPTRVLGHSDIAYSRKSDPGPKFPWQLLYQYGVGAWYELESVSQFREEIKNGRLSTAKTDMISQFRKYGYAVTADMTDSNYRALVRAFQMHFRQSSYSGEMDDETAAILFALNKKYRP